MTLWKCSLRSCNKLPNCCTITRAGYHLKNFDTSIHKVIPILIKYLIWYVFSTSTLIHVNGWAFSLTLKFLSNFLAASRHAELSTDKYTSLDFTTPQTVGVLAAVVVGQSRHMKSKTAMISCAQNHTKSLYLWPEHKNDRMQVSFGSRGFTTTWYWVILGDTFRGIKYCYPAVTMTDESSNHTQCPPHPPKNVQKWPLRLQSSLCWNPLFSHMDELLPQCGHVSHAVGIEHSWSVPATVS